MARKRDAEGNRSEVQRALYRDTNLQIIFTVTLMAVLGVSSITPAFPKIVQELQISPQAVGSLITVFTFPGVILTPVLGVLADQLGRKRILVPSLLLFALAGTACAFARDFNLLLALRFLQGMGAASLGSLNVTIIGDLYAGKQRTAAMGYNASVLSIGTASYPIIGGALATLGWYYPFLLPLVALPTGLLVLFSLHNPEPKNEQQFKEYLSDAWKSIANRQVFGLFAASTFTFIILYGASLTYLPLLMGHSFAAPPFVIGLIVSSSSLSTALTSSQVGRLAKAYSETTLMKAACVLYASSMAIIPFVSHLWLFVVPALIFGIAQGLNMPSIQTLLAGLAPMKQRAALMSINGMVLRLGQTLGPLVMGAVFGLWGTSAVFYAGAGFAIAMLVIVVIMISGGMARRALERDKVV
jgi:ACDE family multidrug resistance protein